MTLYTCKKLCKIRATSDCILIEQINSFFFNFEVAGSTSLLIHKVSFNNREMYLYCVKLKVRYLWHSTDVSNREFLIRIQFNLFFTIFQFSILIYLLTYANVRFLWNPEVLFA